ncbi:hypothetical protein NPX13_g2720 [Xylaria arbuscula]|uniref:Uncharacterized protein n=1 Tax=Xylaria arbuscula TaxID=114810 RepID=A0A9W8NIN1_9PEZI|nr:hypothetical protein NPX13_g2720 [Xylaria arbuscula]
MPPRKQPKDSDDPTAGSKYSITSDYTRCMDNVIDSTITKWPPLTKAQVNAMCRMTMFERGGEPRWTENDLQASDPSNTLLHYVEVPKITSCRTAKRLYKISQDWSSAPGAKPMKSRKLWRRHGLQASWSNKLYLLIAAIQFTCFCENGVDRDHFRPEHHGNPLLKAICDCQQHKVGMSVPSLMRKVKKTLKKTKRMALKRVQHLSLDSRSYLEAQDRFQTATVQEPRPLYASLAPVDNSYKTPQHADSSYKLFTLARPSGASLDRDEPAGDDTFSWVRKLALEGLRANALEYIRTFREEGLRWAFYPSHTPDLFEYTNDREYSAEYDAFTSSGSRRSALGSKQAISDSDTSSEDNDDNSYKTLDEIQTQHHSDSTARTRPIDYNGSNDDFLGETRLTQKVPLAEQIKGSGDRIDNPTKRPASDGQEDYRTASTNKRQRNRRYEKGPSDNLSDINDLASTLASRRLTSTNSMIRKATNNNKGKGRAIVIPSDDDSSEDDHSSTRVKDPVFRTQRVPPGIQDCRGQGEDLDNSQLCNSGGATSD